MEENMRKRIANIVVLAVLFAGTCGWALAQATKQEPPSRATAQTPKEQAPERAVVPLSNPAKPAKIEVRVMRGSITVKAYDGKEVIVEARVREKALEDLNMYFSDRYAPTAPAAPPAPPAPAETAKPMPATGAEVRAHTQAELAEREAARQLADQERLAKRIERDYTRAVDYYAQAMPDEKEAQEEKQKKVAGMKQLSGSSSGLEVEEEGNVVTVSTRSWKAATDLVIQVPRTTSLEIRSSMDGAVVVEGVNGEIDINNINGPVTLSSVSGNTLVHTVNGDITVVLSRVAADKPLSFSTMNGDIDVTLPPDVKANLKMKSEQGEIFSDFDINMTRQPAKAEAAEKTEQGKYRIAFDKSLYGIVNGGGQEIGFNTFSGDIYIRKKK
jgi:hypothetical protein